MKSITLRILLCFCLLCCGCAKDSAPNRYYSFTGTWLKKVGVFGDPSDMYFLLVDGNTRSAEILYHDIVGHTLEGALSPSGRFLAVNGWDRQQDSNNLYVVDLATGVKERLSTALGEEDAFVWVDDQTIVYRYTSHVRDEGSGWTLYKMNMTSKEKTPLLGTSSSQDEYYYGDLAISQSRRYLAYTRGSLENFFRANEPFHNGLYMQDLNTGRERLVYKHETKTIGALAFSPDDQKIAFVQWEGSGDLNHKSELVTIDATTGKWSMILANSTPYYEIAGLVYLDDDHVLFVARPQRSPEMSEDQGEGYSLNMLTISTGMVEPFLLHTADQQQIQTLDYIKPTWK